MNGTCCCVELTVTEDAEVLLSVAEDSQVGLDVEEQFVTGGGITPSGTKEISVTQNGTTTTDVTYYANAKVIANVPNTYTASDEDKVVQDGALEAQTTATFEANDTYDTTTIKQVTVDVPASAVDSGYVYINENDTVDVVGYAQAVVAVPASEVDTGTKSISVTANGTTTHDVVGYASASITANVPNTYAAGDEGKVVDDGELVAQGSATYTINNTYDTTKIKSVTVNVSGGGSPTLQTKSVSYTPSESQQTAEITADEGYDALQEVDITVGAVSSTYVGSGITRRDDTDLSASGPTVSVPSGYYEDSETYTVSSGSATTPATTVTANPSISVNSSTGVITATASATKSVTPTVSAGYVSSGTAGTITVSGSNTSALSTQSGTTITPTTSEQTAVAAGKYTLGAVKVAAMPSGTAGTPTATKGTVSNHSVSVTPSVTNSAGYISSGTLTGTAVTVSASELVSGTKSITANGTNIDVSVFSAVDVSVSGGGLTDDQFVDHAYPQGAFVTSYSGTIPAHTFRERTGITSFTGNSVTAISQYAFYHCTALESVSIPNCTNASGTNMFDGCTALKGIALPSVSADIYGNAFNGCTALKYIDFGPSFGRINASNALNNCSSLTMVVIRKTSVSALNNINNFNGTPFASGGSGGTLYVPNSLVSSYQSASGWSTILGYTNNQIKSIESTHTDPTAPIDLTLYYADGTPIT